MTPRLILRTCTFATALALGTALSTTTPVAAADYVITSQVDAQQLIGHSIKNVNDETVGNVDSVILDQNGRVVAVVVGVGGFLGMGQREVALDWSSLAILDNGRTVRTSFTKDQLKALPEYKFANANQARTVYYDPGYRPAVSDRGASKKVYSTAGVYGAGGELRSSHLIGAPVVNAAGEKIGEITEILVSPKRELAAVISVGGFLSMGEHDVAIDWKKLNIERRADKNDFRVVLNTTREQLKSMPEYKFDSAYSRILR